MRVAQNADDWPSPVRGWVVTIILLIAFTFSFVDRQVLNLLVDPIRADLGVSDTQISFLQGFAFALTYVLMSVPLGRMVDRYNRVGHYDGRRVGVECHHNRLWSFTQLYAAVVCALWCGCWRGLHCRPVLGRCCLIISNPTSWPCRISVYLMGPYLGAGLAMIAGAEVLDWSRDVDKVVLPLAGEVAPWQATFIAVGLPGILIVALLALIAEPVRRGRVSDVLPAWGAVWGHMRANARLYTALHVGVPFIVVMLYGLQAWTPTILLRVYGWDLADAGRIYGVVALVAGSAGVLTGPALSRVLQRRQRSDAPLLVAVFGAIMATLALLMLPLQSTGGQALVCIFIASFSVTLPLALITTVMQEVTPK